MIRMIRALAAMAVLLGAPAALACEGNVEARTVDALYPPFSLGTIEDRFEVVVEAACDWRLVVLTETAAPPLIGGHVAYDIRDDRAVSALVPDLGDRMGGIEGVEAMRRVDLTLVLAPDQGPPPGRYAETLRLRLYAAATGAVLAEMPLHLAVAIPQHLELSLAGADIDILRKFPGRPLLRKLIDFGGLETGETRRLSILLRSNVDNRIRLDSLNRGALAHQMPGSGARIGYTLRLDDRPVDLRTIFTSPHLGPTGTGGTALPLDITIGDVSRALAGRYADTLEITLDTAF